MTYFAKFSNCAFFSTKISGSTAPLYNMFPRNLGWIRNLRKTRAHPPHTDCDYRVTPSWHKCVCEHVPQKCMSGPQRSVKQITPVALQVMGILNNGRREHFLCHMELILCFIHWIQRRHLKSNIFVSGEFWKFFSIKMHSCKVCQNMLMYIHNQICTLVEIGILSILAVHLSDIHIKIWVF